MRVVLWFTVDERKIVIIISRDFVWERELYIDSGFTSDNSIDNAYRKTRNFEKRFLFSPNSFNRNISRSYNSRSVRRIKRKRVAAKDPENVISYIFGAR